MIASKTYNSEQGAGSQRYGAREMVFWQQQHRAERGQLSEDGWFERRAASTSVATSPGE